MGFLASYYFTIREENINRSLLMTNIDYAEQLLDQNMPQDALKKYQEENLKKAIALYNEACSLFTEKENPIEYATIQINLANAYLGLSEIKYK